MTMHPTEYFMAGLITGMILMILSVLIKPPVDKDDDMGGTV